MSSLYEASKQQKAHNSFIEDITENHNQENGGDNNEWVKNTFC